jgi:phage protein D
MTTIVDSPPAPEPVPIFAGPDGRAEDFWVPAFELRTRARSVPVQVLRDTTTVTYTDDITKIDSFDVTLNNWDAQARDFLFTDDDRLLPGRELELWLGYRGRTPLRRVISAEITAIKPTFPSAGQPTITVSGLNLLHRFRRKQQSRVYQGLTDSQIATQIGARLGVGVTTAPRDERPYDYLIQDNEYDIVFLYGRARRIGYELFVQEHGGTAPPSLYFGPSDAVRRVTYQLEYGRSLVEFTPTLTTARQVGSVTVRGWDRVRKKPIEVTVKRSDVGGSPAGADLDPAFDQHEDVVNVIVADEQEAHAVARDRMRDIAHETVTATGSTVGLPDLRSGERIQVAGVGRRFSGRYFVTSTTHTLGDGGYTTSFECRLEAK